MEHDRMTPDRNVKQPEQIYVSKSEGGYVRVAQLDEDRNFSREGEVVIVIHPDDVDSIVSWLQEVKGEIKQSEHFDRISRMTEKR